MVEKITELLVNEFRSVYCDTCAYNYEKRGSEENGCEFCHRKNMYWELSSGIAGGIAHKIDLLYQEDKKK